MGKLVFKDKTYYEGVYSCNNIVKGTIKYFNGTKYEGTFDQTPFDRIKKGTFFFKRELKFCGEWSNGLPIKG